MTQNILALETSLCLNNRLRDRVSVIQTAMVNPLQQRGGSCAVFSPFRPDNDVGNGKLECVNKTRSQCSRKHNGAVLHANFTYFFHYRRFCQQVTPPLLTLDDLLLGASGHAYGAIDITKIDTAGSECDVFAGGARALFASRLRPTLIVVNIGSSRSEACTTALAAHHGYAVHPLAVRSGAK